MSIISSDDVLNLFEKYSDECIKLFVPSPGDEKMINSLWRFFKQNYDLELLDDCIKLYIKGLSDQEAVTVQGFAIVSGKIRNKAFEERRDRMEIEVLMKETQERMEHFK